MSDTALSRGELVVRTIAQTAVDNETYFCELDAEESDLEDPIDPADWERIVYELETCLERQD